MAAELTDEQLAEIRADIELGAADVYSLADPLPWAEAQGRCVDHCRSLLSALSSARESGAAAERGRIAAAIEAEAWRSRLGTGGGPNTEANTLEWAAQLARGDDAKEPPR